jgi:cytochrome c oxidase subunit 2
LLLGGCAGPQSGFETGGPDAEGVLELFMLMLYGSLGVLGLVVLAAAFALLTRGRLRNLIADERTVIAAGVALPIVVLSALLLTGFSMLGQLSQEQQDALEIAVIGERWWWRIVYRHDDGTTTETANELRIPAGRPVRLELTTADVIHSFWVPSLAGKLDMVPGQVNFLRLTASEPGVYRGQCAEYCGGPHALMSFYVVAQPEAAFAQWLEAERAGAAVDDTEGLELFTAAGCGGCHAIRGTEASGRIGPDLTHIGSRLSIGAGTLRVSAEGFMAWIREHQQLKPGNLMPPFDGLSEAETERLAEFLEGMD